MDAHSALDDELKKEHLLLKEKRRLKWFTSGDRNIGFIHSYVNMRTFNKSLSSLLINGVPTSNHSAISKHVKDFYSFLFNVSIASFLP